MRVTEKHHIWICQVGVCHLPRLSAMIILARTKITIKTLVQIMLKEGNFQIRNDKIGLLLPVTQVTVASRCTLQRIQRRSLSADVTTQLSLSRIFIPEGNRRFSEFSLWFSLFPGTRMAFESCTISDFAHRRRVSLREHLKKRERKKNSIIKSQDLASFHVQRLPYQWLHMFSHVLPNRLIKFALP